MKLKPEKNQAWTGCACNFTIYGYVSNLQREHLSVGLIAQSVEHCAKRAEVMGSNPVQAWIVFRLKRHSFSSCVYNCDDHFKKLKSVFHASLLLLTMNFVITLSKWLWVASWIRRLLSKCYDEIHCPWQDRRVKN